MIPKNAGESDRPDAVGRRLRVLLVHNCYQRQGGEEEVVSREHDLLRAAGHDARLLTVSNDALHGPAAPVTTAIALPYSRRARTLVAGVLAETRPDIVHIHNTFPMLTPSILDACTDVRVPVVQTLHNYRLLCANGMLLRDGVPCELCIEGTPYNAVRFACYRGSRSASAAVARMIRTHRRRNTWQTKVDRYIALTNFARTLFVRGGLPADKIATKVNFAPEPASQGTLVASPPYALFLGRLSQEKGVRLLLDSWRRVPFELHVAGDGPLADSVREAASANHRIRYLGRLSRQEVEAEMAGAAFMVFPSVGYESCPSTIIEAFAQATPLLASRLGAAGEIVTNGKTGVHFEAGNPSDLASKAIWLATNVREREAMGRRARREYEHTYSATRNLGMLLGVYADAQAEADRRYGSGAARS